MNFLGFLWEPGKLKSASGQTSYKTSNGPKPTTPPAKRIMKGIAPRWNKQNLRQGSVECADLGCNMNLNPSFWEFMVTTEISRSLRLAIQYKKIRDLQPRL